MRNPPTNVFLIETPLQLLNAIEAKNCFGLLNNCLIVRLDTNCYREIFKRLIDEREWDCVQYITFHNKTITLASKLLGQRVSDKIRGFCYDYQQYLNRKKLDDIALSLGKVKNAYLGNYMKSLYDMKYMYHFANTLAYENLYILDDGTDTLLISDERKNICSEKESPEKLGSWFLRLKATLRKTFIDWNDKDADMVTFFSAYDIEVGNGDRLIRNEYTYLREIATHTEPSDEVFFLGQWLVEDGYMKEDLYLDYLTKVKDYFANERLFYIPHPRESVTMINKIKESLGFNIRRFDVPIEYEISIRENMPKVLASFFSSALKNCQMILGQKVRIKAFYIAPEHLMRAPDLARKIYEQYEDIADENFEVIKL
ncbi:hypothetical protein F6V25_03475 [Oryzomonas japonica]|uniref:Uncharacterized protein n=1 Tax=Oryzomonas japonica TaxID=2603858 RepID=A0A7J4ZT04_9BACT|nr:polysialyltransferase family glycosyltransferase [Oryzomonas japonica]KAB0666493.1 hypothetical protein F6V25_03475 [Oryzomonas japonica]